MRISDRVDVVVSHIASATIPRSATKCDLAKAIDIIIIFGRTLVAGRTFALSFRVQRLAMI